MRVQIYLNKESKRDMLNVYGRLLEPNEIICNAILCGEKKKLIKEAIDEYLSRDEVTL